MIEEKELVGLAGYLEGLGIIDKEKFLETALQEPPEGFIHRHRKRYGTDLMFYQVHVEYDSEKPVLQTPGYIATLLHVGDIDHHIHDGIDTAVLEQRLRGVDWSKPLDELTPHNPDAASARNDLLLLSRLSDKSANARADMLMWKYWAATPMEALIKLTHDWANLEQSFFFQLDRAYNDPDAARAYNLLSGRAVMQFGYNGQHWNPSHWHILRSNSLVKMPLFDLATHLRGLPFARPLNDFYGQDLVSELAAGGKPAVELMVEGKEVMAFLQADPVAGQIAVFDQGMKPLGVKPKLPGYRYRNKGPGI